MKNKFGLALGSGGAKGLAHIGILKILEEIKIQLAGIAGSSIGALIGAHYALYQDVKKLEKLALSVDWKILFQLLDIGNPLKGGLIKGDRLENLFKKWFENKEFSDLKIPLSIVATDMATGKPVVINTGSLAKAVRASISVPIVFSPFDYQEKKLVDGELGCSVPINIARGNSTNRVIAVALNIKKQKHSESILGACWWSLNLFRRKMEEEIIRSQRKEGDIIITPEIREYIPFIGWRQFISSAKVKRIIADGEAAAAKEFKEGKCI